MNPYLSRRLAAGCMLGLAALVTTGCAATRTTESTGEYLDDAAVTTSVKAALVGADHVNAGDINVETFRGQVQLSGFVNDQGQIDRAVAAARKQNGVKSVKNDLRLKTPG